MKIQLLLGATLAQTSGGMASIPQGGLLTVPKNPDELRFMVIGDWGTQGFPVDFPNQEIVGKSMAALADMDSTHFVISVGDNFYGPQHNASAHGVFCNGKLTIAPQDPKFQSDWLSVYNGTRMNQIPWYLVLGNHEAQIQRSTIDPRWNLKDFFYTQSFTVANKVLKFVMISTDLFYFGYDGQIESGLINGNATDTDNNMRNNFIKLGWTRESNTINKQLKWIENELVNSKSADYLIVVGHSDMEACNGTVPGMQPLKGLFDKYKVTAYLFGHKHSLGHVQKANTFYLLSGAGGRSEKCSKPSLDFLSTQGTYGFANIHMNGTTAAVSIYDEKMNLLSTTSFHPRNGKIDNQTDSSYTGANSSISQETAYQSNLPQTAYNKPLISSASSISVHLALFLVLFV
ncbi:Tartrate-resistant acid phosphatase type 5 [Boothiomyces macroporosus]|uniref:Tartrate-resistant acid phosphatase type 5 n=1 Tax=Boothiomyces macroporosus TaxID=261099 RepID=A0AAD5UNA3_9FUNG|nr:Tartrate-resistant acid phosphatase type 5 [Boothiomyces macroporosus]